MFTRETIGYISPEAIVKAADKVVKYAPVKQFFIGLGIVAASAAVGHIVGRVLGGAAVIQAAEAAVDVAS